MFESDSTSMLANPKMSTSSRVY